MKLAVHCANLSWPGGPDRSSAPRSPRWPAPPTRAASRTLTMMDHWFQMETLGGPPEPMLEGYTSLGFLAGQTRNLDLGLLVTGVTYRHPGLLAKIVDHPRRAQRRPRVARHRRRLVRARARRPRRPVPVHVASASSGSRRRCRSAGRCGATTTARSRASTTGWPRRSAPRRRSSSGGPPILIGGSGERKTLRLVAKYADACNLFGFEPDEMKHKIDVLDGHCADVGRDPAEVRRTALAGGDPFDDIDGFLRRMEAYAALGDRAGLGDAARRRTRSATSAGSATRCSPACASLTDADPIAYRQV